MKHIVFLLFICASCLTLQAQTAPKDQAIATTVSSADLWKTLMAVEYKNVPDRYYPQPIFSKDLKALAGKRVTLKGFIIPLDEAKKQMNFMLSMVPFSHCFFCGGAGPESVVEVKASTSFDYTAKPVQVSGVLRLNETDENHLFYILEEASPVL
ncbi:DUF3299 domain-containing protein [Cytophagaceae bacterium DM2B3-1]|uniref:DUF3299 domain-containing protein n=1 Tax=Xanthocytophaga flava TaxID=3048013 RepID=A0AAE3U797_9BACT|nr:DUF3299 domain-containing protein [Xanthocytophaga flavus]MDJ1481382.1 DUF3299 domain-containing protein [Xanthocytophaga flavus]MDJ1491360.1 DUF3299 domain-containing protein [Xanthocytophaga flavus]